MKSYGPYGSKKLIVYSGQRLVVSNDMSLLLKYCQSSIPIEKLILRVGQNVGNCVGDSAMTVVVALEMTYSSIVKSISSYQLKFGAVVRCINEVTALMHAKREKIHGAMSLLNRYDTALSLNENFPRLWRNALTSSSDAQTTAGLITVLVIL